MMTATMTVEKGNIVQGKRHGKHGIVLAVRKDGTRAKVYVYGPDAEIWRPLDDFEVVVSGLDTCGKCLGTGLYYFGGAVVNGSYTGQTGKCYACQGKGKQDNDDRVRCHHYWHRQQEIEAAVEAVERGEEYTPLSVPWQAPDPVVAELHDDDAPPF
jgi:hypothetical protein